VSQRVPREPRDYRRIIDLVGGALVSLVALTVALVALLVAVFSHQVLSDACDQGGPLACNHLLLTSAYVFTLVGVAAAVIGASALQLRAYRQDTGLWAWPLLAVAVIFAVLLLGILLMRTAHPAPVGALGPGTVLP
jgi:hypothetical protein